VKRYHVYGSQFPVDHPLAGVGLAVTALLFVGTRETRPARRERLVYLVMYRDVLGRRTASE